MFKIVLQDIRFSHGSLLGPTHMQVSALVALMRQLLPMIASLPMAEEPIVIF